MAQSPRFRTLLKSIGNDEIVVPALRASLDDPSFKGFSIDVAGFVTRPPDGWFHPSTHPLWPERALYTYLTDPDSLVLEPFDPSSTLAVTAGTFFHVFVQTVLVRQGVLEQQPEVCGCGARHPERAEVYLVDHDAGVRGHADGVVHTGDGFEFKTMNPNKLGRLPRGKPSDEAVLEWLMLKCPDYYAQAQDYMRMSGRRRQIVVIVEMTYPFTMREIHVPYDPAFATEIRDKYLRVRAAARAQYPLRCLCFPNPGDCPSRGACSA